FFSSRRRHTRSYGDWSSDVCSSDLLDCLQIPEKPLDVLAQQIVACAACEAWEEQKLFELMRSAYPYRALSRHEFDDVLRMLAEGDRKSTRLNSSHRTISYAVFCLKK